VGSERPAEPAPPFHFVDVAGEAGLSATTWCGRFDKPHLMESNGTGLALVDYDGDGDLDAYLVNGWRLEGSEIVERGTNRLYRNRGDGTFEDVTEAAGVGDDGWGCGAAVGDVDGDGDPDLYVTNFGPDLLYRNQGDGTFAAMPDSPGIDGWSAAAVFFDADGDGDEDLFVCGYVDSTLEEVLNAELSLEWNDVMVMPGPFGLEGLANRYYVNEGGGRFVDRTVESGLKDVGLYYSFAMAALDLDGDLDLDLYVANDSNPNYLYENDGKGHFNEVGLWSGAAVDGGGAAQAGMGVATGDVDGDGFTDLFVTNFAEDHCTYYANKGELLFEDETVPYGLQTSTFAPLSWGAFLEDLDLDGDLDLFIANGHIYPQAEQVRKSGMGYAQPNQLFGLEKGRFVDRSAQSGPGLEVIGSSRGVACGDVDLDGDLDFLVANVDEPPTLLRNDTARRGAWLLVEAPGAVRVTVVVDEGRQLHRDLVIGGSYMSESDRRFHFGLGEVTEVEEVIAVWSDGEKTAERGVLVNRGVRGGR